jgi:hypothetical protein
MPDGRLELHETKGHFEDDARVKIKWAAKDFGSLFRVIAITEPRRGEWKTEEFPVVGPSEEALTQRKRMNVP